MARLLQPFQPTLVVGEDTLELGLTESPLDATDWPIITQLDFHPEEEVHVGT